MRVVFQRLWNVELRNWYDRNLCQQKGIGTIFKCVKALLLGFNLGRRVLRKSGKLVPARKTAFQALLNGRSQAHLASIFAILFVRLSPKGDDFLIVSWHCGKCLIRRTLVEFHLPDKTNDGIATLDMVIQEVERLAGIVRFKPERDPASTLARTSGMLAERLGNCPH